MNDQKLKAVIREIMARQGWDQTDFGKELKVIQSTVSRWLDGASPQYKHRQAITALAKRLGVIQHNGDLEEPGIPFVGYVGAGGTVNFSEGQGPFGIAEMPPGKVSPETVALIVQGDSMSPQLEDGWSVYYDTRQEKPTETLTNRLCVVGLADGRVLVKTLLPGRLPGCWDLHSKNAGPMLDQSVEWAARVTFIAPSK